MISIVCDHIKEKARNWKQEVYSCVFIATIITIIISNIFPSHTLFTCISIFVMIILFSSHKQHPLSFILTPLQPFLVSLKQIQENIFFSNFIIWIRKLYFVYGFCPLSFTMILWLKFLTIFHEDLNIFLNSEMQK